MKPQPWLIALSVALACLCLGAVVVLGLGYFALQDQPPDALSDSGYYIRRTQVYYHPGFGIAAPFAIAGADVASFKILNSTYAQDAARVYLNGQPLAAADPATFKIIEAPYARDANHVYLGSAVISDDAAHFELLDENLARDSEHIYWAGASLSADPAHLVVLGQADFYSYFKDATTVFVNGQPIQGAAADSFQLLTAGYGRDAAQVFYFDELIPDADAATFTVIAAPYARDAQTVFWLATPIPNADPKTFRVLNANFECAADVAHAYYQDQIISGVEASDIPSDAKANNCSTTDLFLTP